MNTDKIKTNVSKNLGSYFRLIRKENGYTLKQISDATGMNLSFISEFERGVSRMSIENMYLYASAMKFDLSFILKAFERVVEINQPRKD